MSSILISKKVELVKAMMGTNRSHLDITTREYIEAKIAHESAIQMYVNASNDATVAFEEYYNVYEKDVFSKELESNCMLLRCGKKIAFDVKKKRIYYYIPFFFIKGCKAKILVSSNDSKNITSNVDW
jgi:hypothetical protein